MSKFRVDRKDAEAIGWNSVQGDAPSGTREALDQRSMILSVLLDIRDILASIDKAIREGSSHG